MREVEERRRRTELLTLKEQRRGWPEEQQRRQRPELRRRTQLGKPPTGSGGRPLIVVLEKVDELLDRPVECGSAARLLLPGEALALKEKSPRDRRQELPGRATVVGVVGLSEAREGDACSMVKVVVVERVEAVAALAARSKVLGLLRFVLGDDDDLPLTSGGPRALDECGNDVLARLVEHLLRGVQPEPVDVILANPVFGAR